MLSKYDRGKIERLVEKFLSGDFEGAQKSAMKQSYYNIHNYLHYSLLWSNERAYRAAAFLKGTGSIEAYVDAQ